MEEEKLLPHKRSVGGGGCSGEMQKGAGQVVSLSLWDAAGEASALRSV